MVKKTRHINFYLFLDCWYHF